MIWRRSPHHHSHLDFTSHRELLINSVDLLQAVCCLLVYIEKLKGLTFCYVRRLPCPTSPCTQAFFFSPSRTSPFSIALKQIVKAVAGQRIFLERKEDSQFILALFLRQCIISHTRIFFPRAKGSFLRSIGKSSCNCP